MSEATTRPWVRGAVWLGVGALVHIVSLALGRPLMLRGTSIPWGLVVCGAGVVILIWDVSRAGKNKTS